MHEYNSNQFNSKSSSMKTSLSSVEPSVVSSSVVVVVVGAAVVVVDLGGVGQ